MEEAQLKEVFDRVIAGLFEGHQAFLERVIEMSTGDVASFSILADMSEKNAGLLKGSAQVNQSKMRLVIALNKVLEGHKRVQIASEEYAKDYALWQKARN